MPGCPNTRSVSVSTQHDTLPNFHSLDPFLLFKWMLETSTGWQIQFFQHNLQWKMLFVFADIFYWKNWWNFQCFFTPFPLSFEFFPSNQKSGENVLGFPPGFQLKNGWKRNNIFHWAFSKEIWIFQPVKSNKVPWLVNWLHVPLQFQGETCKWMF
jgi:hypothetical protein